jgi:hypothetical protein
MNNEQTCDRTQKKLSSMSWPRFVAFMAAIAVLLGGVIGVSTIPAYGEPVGPTQGKWAGSPDFLFTVAGDQIIDISWTQFVAPWNNKPCKVCMTACKIKNGKVDCKEGNWKQEGKPDRPASTLVGSFDDSGSFTGLAKSSFCSFAPCGQSGGGMSGLDYTATDVKARPVVSSKVK